MRLVERFLGHVRREHLLVEGDRVLVACSGGLDSTALALLADASARPLGLASVTIAHLDHALRPGSEEDAAAVRRLAQRLALDAVVERRPVGRRRGESPEAAARRVRYDFLEDVARRVGAGAVLTAHHMEDQAETVLLRALRGTGPAGLAGIRASRPLRRGSRTRLVRPLLPFRRAELAEHVAGLGETWREDPTNRDGNVRARLRHRAMPVLAACTGRDVVPPLARLAERTAARTVHEAPTPRAADRIPADRTPSAAAIEEAPLRVPGSCRAGDVVLRTRGAQAGNTVFLERLSAKRGTLELLDADAVRGGLVVRGRRPGDRFRPLGAARAARLGHYLQRRGVAGPARDAVPIVCDNAGIVWVVGHAIAQRVRVRGASLRILVVEAVGAAARGRTRRR